MSHSQWFQQNIIRMYSKELGRPLTEPEVRVKRCLEQLSVPDWFLKYSKPTKLLKNKIPIECRTPVWKTMKIRNINSPKPSRKNSFRNTLKKTPRKMQAANMRVSSPTGLVNQTYRITRKTPRKDKSPCISITPSSSETDLDSSNFRETLKKKEIAKLKEIANQLAKKMNHNPTIASNTYPRISPSRRIENINIVFSKPFPPEPPVHLPLKSPKVVYTMTKIIEMRKKVSINDKIIEESNLNETDTNHASFLIAEVEPGGVKTQVVAGVNDSEDDFRNSPSPDTRFFNSNRKSTALERIIQTQRQEAGNKRIQDIIDELDRSVAESRSSSGRGSLDFARSLVQGPKNGSYSEESDPLACSSSIGSSDPDLNKSISISYKSSNSESNSPLPQSEEEDEEDVHWIPCKIVPLTCRCPEHGVNQMPRTSSLLSMQSKSSGISGRGSSRNSPGLSPIRGERADDPTHHHYHHQQQYRGFGSTYTKKEKSSQQQLFRIDETTGVVDSGYSDRSYTASSRTPTYGCESPSWSLSSSPSIPDSENEGPVRMMPKFRSHKHSDFSWCEFADAYYQAFGEILRI